MILEIPREQWAEFCDRFSRQHESWLVWLEVQQATATPQGGAATAAGSGIL